jgi:uncharacterized Tic20 family protein
MKKRGSQVAYCSACQIEVSTGKFCNTCGRQLVENVPPAATQISSAASASNKSLAMWAHLAPLLGGLLLFWLVFPIFLLWLAPLLMRNSAKTEFERRHATESLNFQLTQLVLLVPAALLVVATFGIGYFVVVAFSIVSIIFMIMASVAASGGNEYRYPICFRFVK